MTNKFFSIFEVEGMVVEHIMNMYELVVTSALTLSFTSSRSLFKLFSSKLKITNPLLKYYSNILLGHLSMTTDSLLFKIPWQDNKLNNRCGITNPNTLSYSPPRCLWLPETPRCESLNFDFSEHNIQYKHNCFIIVYITQLNTLKIFFTFFSYSQKI